MEAFSKHYHALQKTVTKILYFFLMKKKKKKKKKSLITNLYYPPAKTFGSKIESLNENTTHTKRKKENREFHMYFLVE